MLLQECRWMLVGVGIGLLLALEGCGGVATAGASPEAGAVAPDAGPCEPSPSDVGDCRSALAFCKDKDAGYTCGYTPDREPFVLERDDAGACAPRYVDTPNGCEAFPSPDGGDDVNCCVVPGL